MAQQLEQHARSLIGQIRPDTVQADLHFLQSQVLPPFRAGAEVVVDVESRTLALRPVLARMPRPDLAKSSKNIA